MNPSERLITSSQNSQTGAARRSLASARLSSRPIARSSRSGSGWEARVVCDGIIAVGNAHKDKVKLTFAQGAQLPDPDKIFNAASEATGGEPSIFSKAKRE